MRDCIGDCYISQMCINTKKGYDLLYPRSIRLDWVVDSMGYRSTEEVQRESTTKKVTVGIYSRGLIVAHSDRGCYISLLPRRLFRGYGWLITVHLVHYDTAPTEIA